MTSRTLGLIALIAGFAIGGEVSDWPLLGELAMGLLVLLIVSAFWARSALSGISVSRSIEPNHLQVGDVLTDVIQLRTRSQIGKLWVEVRDRARIPGHDGSNVVSLRRKGSAAWSSRSICVRRGSFPLGPVELHGGDPLGVFQRSTREMITGDLIVYPPVFDLPALRLPFADATGRREIERRALMSTPAVATIRDYVSGDPLNKIAWSLTARMGKLMVKEFDLDPTSELWIITDFSREANLGATRQFLIDRAQLFGFAEAWFDSTEDLVASLAASVTRIGLDARRAVGYIGCNANRTFVPADSGDRQYHRILGELAVARADGPELIADLIIREVRRFDRNRTPVVISSSADPRWIDALAGLTERGIRPIGIFIDPSSFDPERDANEVTKRIRDQVYPVFVVDFNDGIDEAFAINGAASASISRPEQVTTATRS